MTPESAMDAKEALDNSLQSLGASPLNLHAVARGSRESYIAEKIEKPVGHIKESMATASGKINLCICLLFVRLALLIGLISVI